MFYCENIGVRTIIIYNNNYGVGDMFLHFVTRLLVFKPSGPAMCLTIPPFSIATEEQIVRI